MRAPPTTFVTSAMTKVRSQLLSGLLEGKGLAHTGDRGVITTYIYVTVMPKVFNLFVLLLFVSHPSRSFISTDRHRSNPLNPDSPTRRRPPDRRKFSDDIRMVWRLVAGRLVETQTIAFRGAQALFAKLGGVSRWRW